MRVYKDTPFEFSLMPWELQPPATSAVLIVKATYDIVPGGECVIAAEQEPCLGPVPWEDGDAPSLRKESDYAVFKPRGEWYLHGHAYTPGGKPQTVVTIEAKVGSLHKRLHVWGDRHWSKGLLGTGYSAPSPFTRMPLRWERSYGGPRNRSNPVGRGIDPIIIDGAAVETLANIEGPASLVLSREDHPEPAGMFVIPGTWAERTRHMGTYDTAWRHGRWPYFPLDFRFEYFQAAPPDQRLAEGYWSGRESIELVGLHPDESRVVTRLPSLRARAFVERVSRPAGSPRLDLLSVAELEEMPPPALEAVQMALDTIVVDTDRSQILCTWRGLVRVADAYLSDVERLFFLHEPCGETLPLEHYSLWLRRKVLGEAAEFEWDEDELLGEGEPQPGPVGVEAPEQGGRADLDHQLSVLRDNLPAALAPLYSEHATPEYDEYREHLRRADVEPDDLLPPLEVVVPPPELEEPASLLRLAAIIRRRLGKPFADLDLSRAPYRGLDLSGVDFTNSLLTDADLSGCCLRGCLFDGAILHRARLEGVDARGAHFGQADLTDAHAVEANFEGSNFDRAIGEGGVFSRSSFLRCTMLEADFTGAQMDICDLRETRLDGADFTAADLKDAGFVAASMVDTSLESVNASGAVFDRAIMPDLRASDGAQFAGARFMLVDAPRSQFQGSNLCEANLSGSNFASADFSQAQLARANLVRASAPGATFDRADLREAKLMQFNGFEASFSEALLSNADLRGANLFSANLYRVETSGTLFDGANLHRTYLDTV